MAYDYFSDTPFDLNHDGKIDSNEAAYIYGNFFNEDNNKCVNYEEEEVESANNQQDSNSTFHRIASNEKNYSVDVDELMKAAKKEDYHKGLFMIGVVVALLIIFPSSPGVGLFVGGILLILKISN